MITVIVFILTLGLLVLVHEFGHFIVAKKSGVLVEEFGLGFPPRLFGIKIGETLYSLNLIPLGGFVKVYGEEFHEISDNLKKDPLKDRAFVFKSPIKKTAILVAGVIMNFLLGWVLISYLFTQGVPTPTNKVIVAGVSKNSPAQISGIKEGDVVSSFISPDNSKIELSSANKLISLTQKYAGNKIELNILRNNKQIRVSIVPRMNPPKGEGSMGISITSFVEKKYPWYQAPYYGLIHAFDITRNIVIELLKTFGQLLMFKKPNVDIAGPVGIARYTGEAIKVGKNALLELIALLSLNLAVVNILPFPALDGGRLVFVIYEAITKKRVNQKIEKNLNLAGIIILLSLAALITVRDIMNIYK